MDLAHYAQQYKRFLWCLKLISQIMPLRFGYPMAALSAHYLSPRRDEKDQVIQTVEACLSDEGINPEKTWHDFLNHVGATDMNTFLYRHMNQDWLKRHVDIDSELDIPAALAQGKGLLLMTYHNHYPHFFAVLLGLMGYKTYLIARDYTTTPIYPFLEKMAIQYYSDCESHFQGGSYIYVSDNTAMSNMRSIHHALKTGNIVVSLNDFPNTFAPKRSMTVEFYGRPLTCPIGTVQMALKQGAVIGAGWVRWIGQDRYQLEIKALDTQGDVDHIMHQYFDLLESLIKTDPSIWEGWRWLNP